MIFGFHWNGGTAKDVDIGRDRTGTPWSYYGLQELSNNSAIFVAPQGLGNGWANSGGEDLTFVDDMVKLIEDNLLRRHDAASSPTGFSYGGGMSYAIACARAKVFRARRDLRRRAAQRVRRRHTTRSRYGRLRRPQGHRPVQ